MQDQSPQEDKAIDLNLIQIILDNIEAKFNGNKMPWKVEAKV